MFGVTTEELIIAIVRILGSLPVLQWPLVGGVLAILIDLSDLFMMNLLDMGGVRNYQVFDKWLDQVYMLTFLVVAVWKWDGLDRAIAVALYAFRMVGFVAFEVTDARGILIFFPNVFEFWFLFVAARRRFWPERTLSPRGAVYAFVPLLAAKVFQEYVLHVGKWLDGFTAVEAVEWIWDFVWPF